MRKMNRIVYTAMLGAVLLLCACGTTTDKTGAPSDAKSAEEAGAGTAEAKPELLVVSFGTSYNDSRNITIGGIENALREAFPDYDVVRAFTAQIIIDKLKDRDGIEIMNVEEALDDAVARGVKEMIVQPTHLMDGFEYQDIEKLIADYEDKFDKIVLSEPLLMSDDDYQAVVEAITARTSRFDDGQTAICFMGHGTEAESNQDYTRLQQELKDAGFENYYIGTVEAEPSFTDVIDTVKASGKYKKVVLLPLMVVAGDHANNDMAGDEEDSWKSLFEAEGFEVECVLEGLGQDYNIEQIYVDHARKAAEELE